MTHIFYVKEDVKRVHKKKKKIVARDEQMNFRDMKRICHIHKRIVRFEEQNLSGGYSVHRLTKHLSTWSRRKQLSPLIQKPRITAVQNITPFDLQIQRNGRSII